VLVLVKGTALVPETFSFDFKNVRCFNEDARNTVIPRIQKLGPDYLLQYIPTEKGKFRFEGLVAVSGGNFTDYYRVSNNFRVTQ
jgi:hypothetical protein